MFKRRYPGLWKVFVGPQHRNAGLFLLILIPNILAALLEGLSFATLLMALSIISENSLPPSFSFFSSYFPFFESLDQKSLFLFLVVLAILFQTIRSLISGIALHANTSLCLRIQKEAQLRIYWQIFNLSYRCVSQYKAGDLAEHASTPSIIMNPVMDAANRFLISFFMIFVTLALMFFLNVKLALLTLFLLALTGSLHKSILSYIGHSSQKLSHFVVECTKQTVQALQAMRTIHTYNRQQYIFEKIKQNLKGVITFSKKVYFWHNFFPATNELLGTFLVAILLISGIWILDEGMLPVLLTFIALTHRLVTRFQIANGAIGTIAVHKGSILRLEEILSDEGKEFVSHFGKPFPGLVSSIDFENVFLQYSSSNRPAIQGISFKVPKGTTVALVGTSGAGKSSILDLFLRLYEPTQGAIQIDGIDLQEYNISSWRDHLGVVSQDISIFNDTIEENIRFGLEEKSFEEVLKAAKFAGLHDFILTLPDGYQTIVGERGFRLSGGQRQRLALARALVRNPKILVLDEATSNLDSHSELLIQKSLEKLHHERTILVVAHRLSTIMKADVIYVLDHGKIVEEGTHDFLLEKKGTYAHFWKLQAASTPRSYVSV